MPISDANDASAQNELLFLRAGPRCGPQGGSLGHGCSRPSASIAGRSAFWEELEGHRGRNAAAWGHKEVGSDGDRQKLLNLISAVNTIVGPLRSLTGDHDGPDVLIRTYGFRSRHQLTSSDTRYS